MVQPPDDLPIVVAEIPPPIEHAAARECAQTIRSDLLEKVSQQEILFIKRQHCYGAAAAAPRESPSCHSCRAQRREALEGTCCLHARRRLPRRRTWHGSRWDETGSGRDA